MRIEPQAIPEVLAITPKRIGDARGYFSEIYRKDVFERHCPGIDFVQDNQSLSADAGTLRGLHFQTAPFAQAKLVRVLSGAILDVAVDIRRGSPTYGRHVALRLDAEAGTQLFIPAGFAHGFCTLEPATLVHYKVNSYYSAANDKGLAFDDPALAVPWPVAPGKAVLSAKDRTHPRLADFPAYFSYSSG